MTNKEVINENFAEILEDVSKGATLKHAITKHGIKYENGYSVLTDTQKLKLRYAAKKYENARCYEKSKFDQKRVTLESFRIAYGKKAKKRILELSTLEVKIIEQAASYYQLEASDVILPTRVREITEARNMVAYVFKSVLRYTLDRIGETAYLHKADHTTIIHGISTAISIAERYDTYNTNLKLLTQFAAKNNYINVPHPKVISLAYTPINNINNYLFNQ
jgi:hypothetical protein